VSLPQDQQYDDLAIDYSIGQVLEAFSILEVRSELMKWSLPHIAMVANTLASASVLPPHVGQSVAVTSQHESFTPTQIVAGLQHVASTGAASPTCNLRSLRSYLTEWRRQLRALRPAPKFSQRTV
jgi:hypothetical protein